MEGSAEEGVEAREVLEDTGACAPEVVGHGVAARRETPAEGQQQQAVPVADTSDTERVAVRQATVTLEPVYFDTDEARLRIEARGLLKSYAKSIVDQPEWGVITIDGHCDERGSDQYNQVLGRSRAAAVKRYLLEMGVPPARVAIRTFGAARPAVLGHDESAWSYNRRSEFQIEMFASANSESVASVGPPPRIARGRSTR